MDSIIDTIGLFSDPAEEAILRLELVLLRTYESYDSLHCYVSLAGSLPRWYPDADHNQATDEYFLSKGHGWWETAPALEGDSAPIITWPGDESLPMTLSCVGVAGGTEAVELGRTGIQIPPQEWNGIQHNYFVDGEGGGYFFATRVTEVDTIPRRRSKYIDPDMPVPTNVRINDEESTLEWDFVPDPEEPIDGFRIYLNDTLQWTEPVDARESRLPNEWINPPCASTYTFGVSSYRIEYPDGPESEQDTFTLTQSREGCTREMQVTFLTLETFDLGGDGDYEDRRGDVGPAYGDFFAIEEMIEFNGRREGLSHNTTYDIGAMAADPDWRFSSDGNSIIVDVPQGGSLYFGYSIRDRDEDNPNDTICEGRSNTFDESREGIFNRVNEELIISDNRRCDVLVRWGPAFDSPVGGIAAGEEPLPWLRVEDLSIDEATGEVSIDIRNTGTATWASRDLEVEIQDRLGRSLGIYTWPEYELSPGEYDTLQQEHMVVSPPFDACVEMDPNNAVLEEGEILGTTAHGPYCPRVPDLNIIDAYYSPVGGQGRIIAMVQNSGHVELRNRTLDFEVRVVGGATLDYSVPRVSLAPGEVRPFHIRGVTESMREDMVYGYSVTLNPGQSIVESDYLNNRFQIHDGDQIAFKWVYIEVPYRYHDVYSHHFDAYIVTGRHQEQIVNWDVNQNVSWGSCGEGSNCIKHFHGTEFSTARFMLYGDQELRVVVTMTPRGDPLHGSPLSGTKSTSWNFGPPTWGGGEFNTNTLCDYYPLREGGIHRRILDTTGSQSWKARLDICWEGYGR
jgi:hypothetical protein